MVPSLTSLTNMEPMAEPATALAPSHSAVRLRTDAAKRYKELAHAEALIWKIPTIAEKKFRRLNSPELPDQVYDAELFEGGTEVQDKAGTPRRLNPFNATFQYRPVTPDNRAASCPAL